LNGAIGQLGWGLTPLTSCGNAFVTGAASHPGIYFLNSGSASGSGCALSLSNVANGAAYPLTNLGAGGAWSSWNMQAIILTDQYGVSDARYLIGLSDNNGTYHPANGNEIAVRFDSGGGGCPSNESTTNWVYEVIVNGTKTCVNSGLAVAVNTWYHVSISSTAPGTIQFQINGAYAGSISTAPTATLGPLFMNLTTGGSTVSLSVDWWAMKVRGLAR
jgi:hypothetical protein